MKKLLPFAFSLVATWAAAAPSPVPSQEFEGCYATSISDNGFWLVGQLDEPATYWIQNLLTNETWLYGGNDEYTLGIIKAISNNGIAIGEVNNEVAWWENGEWRLLPNGNQLGSSIVGSITPDGKIIVGSLGRVGMTLDDEQMTGPCFWVRQDDGSYSEPIFINGPTKDFFGATPQYLNALAVSNDGNVIAATMTSWSGFYNIPYVFTKSADGSWSYKELGMDLVNPDHLEVPGIPADYNGPLYPNWEPYITSQQLAEMEEAFPAWVAEQVALGYDDFEIQTNELYFIAGFMSEENRAKFMLEVEAYVENYIPWYENYLKYIDFMIYLESKGVSFIMNNAFVSADGKYLYATAEKMVVTDPTNPEEGYDLMHAPVRFDVATGEATLFSWEPNIVVSSVTENGSIMGKVYKAPSDPYIYAEAYIFPEGNDNPVKIQDYFEETGNIDAYTWLEDHLYQEVDINDVGGKDDFWCLGMPISTPDMSVMAFTTSTFYWTSAENAEFLWMAAVLNTGLEATGVEAVAPETSDSSIAIIGDGRIEVKGEVAAITVYDLSGQTVFSAVNPTGVVSTGLPTGVYVVRATTTAGEVITRKALF